MTLNLLFKRLSRQAKLRSLLCLLAASSLTQVIAQQEPTPAAPVKEQNSTPKTKLPYYKVSQLEINYVDDYQGLPGIDFLQETDVYLEKTEEGFTAPTKVDNLYKVRLNEIQDLSPDFTFSRTALRLITRRIVEQINKKGIIGIYAFIDFDQISPTGEDLRGSDDLSLRILITASTVSSIKALQAGADITDEDTWKSEESLPEHTQALFERIYRLSPVQIADPDIVHDHNAQDGFSQSLIQKGLLQDYLYFLNRHPGRRVDLKIKPEDDLEASIFFLVLEGKPWRAAFNTSNTGEKWVSQLDLVHYQLTDNDDIFKASYITNDFEDFSSFVFSYEAPLFYPFSAVRDRWEVHWSGSEFQSSLGILQEDPEPEFSGEQFSFGGKVITNIYQYKDFFFDFVFDGTFKNIKTLNRLILEEDKTPRKGKGHFLVPSFTLKASKVVQTHNYYLGLTLERAYPTYGKDLFKLGRGDETGGVPDKAVTIYRLASNLSFYLEPFVNAKEWANISTPESSTLAHEMQLSARCQYTTNRLIPQFKGSVGGPSSVRGYPQGSGSGDTTYNAIIEYRLHIPRTFSIQSPDELDSLADDQGNPTSRPFKWAPAYVYDTPDWDLVAKSFMDYGRSINMRRTQTPLDESNEELWSVGLGLEFLYKSNLQIKADWGMVLKQPATNDNIKVGYSRWHINISAIY